MDDDDDDGTTTIMIMMTLTMTIMKMVMIKTAQTPACFWHICLHMKIAYCYKCVMICLTIDYLAIVVTTLH